MRVRRRGDRVDPNRAPRRLPGGLEPRADGEDVPAWSEQVLEPIPNLPASRDEIVTLPVTPAESPPPPPTSPRAPAALPRAPTPRPEPAPAAARREARPIDDDLRSTWNARAARRQRDRAEWRESEERRAREAREREESPSVDSRRVPAAPAPVAVGGAVPRRPALQRLGSRVGLLLWLGFLIFGFAVTPRAVGDLLLRDELPEARVTRERIGLRLASLRDRFVLLAEDVDDERRRVEKIRIAYGLQASPPRLPERQVDPKSFPSSIFLPLIEETATLATHARIEVVELEAQVAALRAFERASPDHVSFTPALAPLQGEFVMTSPFGPRQSTFTEEREYHAGVDLAAAVGTPVIAPANGRVVFVGRFPVTRDSTWWRLGNVVAVKHGDDLLTLYGHLGKLEVRTGQTVARGDVLSEIGESGVIANPHLHYAVWRRAAGGSYRPIDARLMMLDRQWDDEEELLAKSIEVAPAGEYEPLPRQLK